MNATFPTNPARKVALPEVESPDCPEAQEMIRRKMPFRCRVKDWGLLNWNMAYLKNKVGHVERKFIRVADKQPFTATTSEFLGWLEEDPGWKSKYMPDGFVGPPISLHQPENAVLLEDVKMPSYVSKSWGAGIMIRNSRANAAGEFYDTPCHYEENVRPAIYVQVLGTKTLWLFSPDEAPHLGVDSFFPLPPFISNCAESCSIPERLPQLAEATCYEVVLEPGVLVHWPEFWFHWFVHHHDFQMNMRLDWDIPKFELNPISASWAYVNSLAQALGGFQNLEKAFAALPEETRTLLTRIEQNLINMPTVLHGRKMTLERFAVGGQAADQTAYKPPVK